MRPPEPTRRQKERFIKASRFVFRMEFTVDFTTPVTIQQGREWARRMLDSLELDASQIDAPDELDEGNLKCAELKRLLRVKVRQE